MDAAISDRTDGESNAAVPGPQPGRTFRNWNGSDVSQPRVVAAPRNLEDLINVVRDQKTYPSPVRAAGSFHSMNACFETTGTQILTKAFDGVEVDLDSRTVTVGAAVTLLQIRNKLRPLGMQLEVTPEIGNATAGSVCCCGTKDSSLGPTGLGQVSSSVCRIKLVNPRGEVEDVSEESDPQGLFVLRSSYGLLGVVYEVTFRIQPAVALRYEYAVLPLDPAPTMEAMRAGADAMLGFAQPYANRIIVERRYRLPENLAAFSAFSRAKRRGRDVLWESGASFFPTRIPHNWWFDTQDRLLQGQLRILTAMGGFRAHRWDSTVDFKPNRSHYVDFTFWAVPVSRWSEFTPAVRKFCGDFRKETGFRMSIMAEVYSLAQDQHSLLSPSPNEEMLTMDVVDTRIDNPLWAEFNKRFNELAASFGGRPLLNQTKYPTRSLVRKTLGAEWDRFIGIRQKVDPDGRFLNRFFSDLI
jgi:FAD/FMN-containing dehydrogenase